MKFFSLSLTILATILSPSEQLGQKEETTCIQTGALAPMARPGLTASDVCARDYDSMGLYDPYECSFSQYYCCASGSSPDQGTGCTLITDDYLDGTECVPTGALAPLSRPGLTPEEVCARDYASMQYLAPYSCTGSPGYACCAEGSAETLTPGQSLGTCTPYTSGASAAVLRLAAVAGMTAVVTAATGLLL